MTAPTPEEEGGVRGWWNGLPGALKAAAALVTAVTGLLIALQQVGVLGRDAPADGPAAATYGPAAEGDVSPAPAVPRYTVSFPSGRSASLLSARATGSYEVLRALAEDRGGGTLRLGVAVRLTNEGPLDLAFGSDEFRLRVDGVPRAPLNTVIGAVDARSAGEATFLFDVPASARELVLEIDNQDDAAALPLVLERAG